LLAEAAIEDGWGDPVAWLREALGFFDQRGCGRIAAACRTLLARAGATVPRRGRGSSLVPPALRARGVTSREVDVLVLVIEGLTNKQIAQRLYLSPKTVEKHIEHLMDKTGARSRAQLSGAAAAAGLEINALIDPPLDTGVTPPKSGFAPRCRSAAPSAR
jgi:DNA-binding CsgD family transcriptional regulator